MRTTISALRHRLTLGLGLLAAIGSGSARECRAAALPFRATLTIQVNPVIAGSPLVVVAGSGVAISDGPVGGPIQTLMLAASALATTALVVPVTDPAAAPIRGYQLTMHNPAGSFVRSGGGVLGGTLPLAGAFKACLFAPCLSAAANLLVPLSPFGSPVDVATLGPGSMNTVRGAPWTTGPPPRRSVSLRRWGSAHGPGSGPSSTFAPGGRVRLVVPVLIQTNLEPVPILATLTLDFVPEPGTLVLLGGGVAGLAALGRRRRRA